MINLRALRQALGYDNLVQRAAGMAGEMQFKESITEFADNDLGSGAVIAMQVCLDLDNPEVTFKRLVRLNWLEWNRLEFEEIAERA